jgi:hypothetical protein
MPVPRATLPTPAQHLQYDSRRLAWTQQQEEFQSTEKLH